jgi:dienelactone hydrolase
MERHLGVKVLLGVLALASLGACSFVGLPNVPVRVSGAAASPPTPDRTQLATDTDVLKDWEERQAPLLREAFQKSIYGRFPEAAPVAVAERKALRLDIAGIGEAEEWTVEIKSGAREAGFAMVVMLPPGPGPAPILVMQNFCGNALALNSAAGVSGPRRGPPKECQNSLMLPLVPVIFGGAIMHPPFERLLEAGYGVAILYAGDVVPDEAGEAEAALQGLTPLTTPPDQRTGAIAAWAWTYLRALDALSADPRIDASRIVLWGHSRNGKAALLAAAMDARPKAAVALQSGTAGASLGRDDVGESIAEITGSYPHWFAPSYKQWAGNQAGLPVDQHQLLALVAPRPVLLGAARRDQWSDPHGAARAAAGASPVYELYGAAPFTQTDLTAPDYKPNLVVYMRPGLHGVHHEDWDRVLEFLAQKVDPE